MNISTICETILGMLDKARTPVTYIPGVLLACSAINRPGLSVMSITANIIKGQAEAGVHMGVLPDGSPNLAERMELVRVREIIKAIKLDGAVQVGIPIGGIQIQAVGAGGVVQGFNVNAPHGAGVMQ